MRIRVSRSARKHLLSSARIAQALRSAELQHTTGDARTYYGTTDDGIELEMILVPDDKAPDGNPEDAWTVIHAMPRKWRDRRKS
ncbi:hypothetical protein [Cellulomonas sp. HZM]|uniref:hypothetical protein n=1 Tax=Cellulomonas sp. HZM TaxID=1454010 RepID=UPI0004930865|nr:hypothetical protein [Cellulomonas sp. HZM]